MFKILQTTQAVTLPIQIYVKLISGRRCTKFSEEGKHFHYIMMHIITKNAGSKVSLIFGKTWKLQMRCKLNSTWV